MPACTCGEDAAELLAAALERQGHTVRIANDGRAGLAALELRRPDVMLLDIGLPGMDGHEVAERVRSRFPRGTLTLIAVTGYGQASDRDKTERAGFDEHLVKPVAIPKLSEALSRHTVGGSTARP